LCQLEKKKKLESRLRAAFLRLEFVGMRITRFLPWAGGVALAMVAGCASVPPDALPPEAPDIASTPWASVSQNGAGAAAWSHYALPGKKQGVYKYARRDNRDALAVTSSSSASMVRRKVRIEPSDLGAVRFSWNVPQLIADADLAQRDTEDSPVRIILAFEGDRSRFSPKDTMLSELARAVTGEELPYATLMYVWCNQRPAGSVIVSSRTDRIRKLVLESGAGRLNTWLDYERDIRADYRKVFGEEPGALVGIGIMTDTDNTRSFARAWYGPLQLAPVAARRD
jgi:hypothetical protein